MQSSARSAAREAQSATPFRVLARAGYVASGVVHALLGALVIVVAFGGTASSDQSGAFEALAAAPLGVVLVWVLAGALWALAGWHVVRAVAARQGGALGRRVSSAAQAVAFLTLGGIAASVALGARPDGERSTEQASDGVLSLPGGAILLLVAAGVVAGVGVGFVALGCGRRFRSEIRVPDGAGGAVLVGLGVFGYVAKGLALVVVGVLLTLAAVQADATTAGGFDGAIRALLELPAGPLLACAVGVGFVAYGLFQILRGWFARLEG